RRGLWRRRAGLADAGRRGRVFGDGVWAGQRGWGRRIRREMPRLGKRWLSLRETPDLDLVRARFAPRDAAIFRAGLELSAMHLGLYAASLLVQARLLRSLVPFAGLFRWAAERLKVFGSDR